MVHRTKYPIATITMLATEERNQLWLVAVDRVATLISEGIKVDADKWQRYSQAYLASA